MTARSLRSLVLAPLLVVALIGTVSACTKSTPTVVATTTTTQTITRTPSSGPTGPVSTAPLVEKPSASCPLIGYDEARSDAGFRLQTTIGTLTQDGKFAGCRFYPNPFPGERLPPATQVAIEIVVSPYASVDAAHNAFIQLAEAGKNFQQETIASGNTGLCYQTTLWAPDNGTDWACTFAKGSKVVVIRTVVTSPALNVLEIAQAVYPKV